MQEVEPVFEDYARKSGGLEEEKYLEEDPKEDLEEEEEEGEPSKANEALDLDYD
ncbi:hypothetical protein J1N35_034422 [Gossypium stocksii]|uniref:Uncharacterized protein n=1 Tax=Gossypium stocksii TaxID=47602 RepID=A0A9D3US12_9ROSI|nr:hypothetical protein J1N35_034422 [Gossypium stocksii]